MSDDDLDSYLLLHITEHWRKAMRVIATVFVDNIQYKCHSELLWGFGDNELDPMLERCIGRLRALVAEGRIEAAGDLSEPRFSEVRLPA